ncbi:hypothetical protein [Paenibacillus sp. 1P03SA]|uniref:hypothetical protein n=1 Tax=Paenibacillus sp. 1P03SA TaxID=3132294 RepID=UPI0039A04F35
MKILVSQPKLERNLHGEPLFISKCDVRSRIVNLRTKEITVCEDAVKEDIS